MQYLIGALVMSLFFVALIAGFYLGRNQQQRPKPKEQPDEEQVRKAKELRKGFEQLMSYDVSKAISRRE